jgi:hypothetical protein
MSGEADLRGIANLPEKWGALGVRAKGEMSNLKFEI